MNEKSEPLIFIDSFKPVINESKNSLYFDSRYKKTKQVLTPIPTINDEMLDETEIQECDTPEETLEALEDFDKDIVAKIDNLISVNKKGYYVTAKIFADTYIEGIIISRNYKEIEISQNNNISKVELSKIKNVYIGEIKQ